MQPAALFALLVGTACAAIMGFAINRGATCMVAAVEQVVRERRAHRIAALVEASLWVAGGMMLAAAVGLMPGPVTRYAISGATLLGGALLGVGAYVNRACVFGSVARFGSGEWHYAATPPGFLAGCILILPWLPATGIMSMPGSVPDFPQFFGVALVLFAFWRGCGLMIAARRGAFASHIWAPHQATSVIGITFVMMLLTVGAWTYPEALVDLARNMSVNSLDRMVLFAALLCGAVWGGRARRHRGEIGVSLRGVIACFCGGALMGMGSVMIPGGNDNLILVGLPFLQPHAWLAIAAMAGAIGACLLIEDVTKRALDSPTPTH